MASASVWRRAAVTPLWPELLLGTGVLVAVAAATTAPLASLLLLLAVAGVALLVKRPFLIAVALIVLMGNVKVNYYLGFFTLFPEYLVLMVACGLGFVMWLSRPAWPPERRLLILFLVWMATGLMSVPFAMSASKVLARVILMGISLVTLTSILTTVNSRSRLSRAVALWEVVATLYAAFGIVQMVGMVAGFDTTLHFLEPISNPDIYLGVGAPVRRRIGDVFRANSMFNDPNILGGFLATAMAATLALRQHHADSGRKARAAAETLGLFVMSACLLLTQSRSGVLAFFAGAGVVFAHRPRSLGRPALWLAAGAAVAAIVGVALVLGIDPTLLMTRFSGTADTSDYSNRQHLEVFVYGLQLIARYPFTGVGLGNFGMFYGTERDAWFAKMMSHSAPLSAFAESGIPGGLAFLRLWGYILRRLWRSRPAAGDAQANALRVALLASLVALLVANLFYDYLLRTFVWVIVGLAMCLVRLTARDREPRGAA